MYKRNIKRLQELKNISDFAQGKISEKELRKKLNINFTYQANPVPCIGKEQNLKGGF